MKFVWPDDDSAPVSCIIFSVSTDGCELPSPFVSAGLLASTGDKAAGGGHCFHGGWFPLPDCITSKASTKNGNWLYTDIAPLALETQVSFDSQ